MSHLAPDRPVALRGLRYLGSHPSAPSRLDPVDVLFGREWIRFERGGIELGELRWDRVRDLSVEGEWESRRMTVPRVFVFGVFAALFKKSERHVLLRIADDRGAWLFEVAGISFDDLRDGISGLRSQHIVR